ncbi:hypothetical protein PMIN06_007340 [Paraphaeosphaeria minitans]
MGVRGGGRFGSCRRGRRGMATKPDREDKHGSWSVEQYNQPAIDGFFWSIVSLAGLFAGGLRDGAALSLSLWQATAQIWLDVLEQNQDLHTPSGASHAPGVSSRHNLHSCVGVHVNRHHRAMVHH